jgi:hypothetical protein
MGGWSQPPELRYEMSLPELASQIQRELLKHTASKGRLYRALGTLSHYKLSQRPIGVRIRIDGVPYARIRDKGGRIPDRKARKGKYMKFQGNAQYPGLWYLQEAKGYQIPAWDFTQRGFEKWAKLTNGRGIRIVWKRENQRRVAKQ